MKNIENNILDFLLYGIFLDDNFINKNDINFSNINSFSKINFSKSEITEKFEFLIRRYIENFLKENKNKKIGILLSGGIDSAIILSYLSKSSCPVYAYTWGGWGENTTDVVFSKISAKKFNVKKHKIIYSKNNYSEEKRSFLKEIKSIKKPLNYHTAIPYIYLREEILKDGVDIVFNGQNADTLCMAYPAPVHVYKIDKFFKFFLLNNLITPLHLMRIFKSSGCYKYIKPFLNFDYEKRILKYYKKINCLKIGKQQKIVAMEEAFTESPYCQNHQKEILESRGIKVYNPYYDESFIKFMISLPDYYRKKDNYNKYLFYELAKNRNVPSEIINKPKKGLSYGYTDFLEKKLHISIFKEMIQDENINKFIDVNSIYKKDRNNFFLFDRLRSVYYFLKVNFSSNKDD